MNPLEIAQSNLLSPMVLAFALGLVAALVRSDLRIPPEVYTALSIYLLLAIGIKGGQQLAATTLSAVWRPAVATVALGVATPVLAYAAARSACRFGVADAAALAAHYGSVSAVTFAAVLTFLDTRGVAYEGFMPALVAVLEVPAIVIGIVIARLQLRPGASADAAAGAAGGPQLPGGAGSWRVVLHEVLTGRSVVLLVGGLVMGYASSKTNVDRVAPLFVQLFHGVLVLFLLDMGTVAAQRLREIGRAGWLLAAFAIAVPLVNGALGVAAGKLAGLSFGGGVVLGVMAASASYIAAPAAVRLALPQANPSYYLTAAVGITFPFNLALGIPLVYAAARVAYGQ